MNYSPSLVIKAYQQCLKISGIVLPTADPEIYFHQFFELFTGKSIITDSDRSFFLRRFSSLHQLYHSAYYFEGRLPQAAFFATFLTCLSPIIPLTNVKIIEFSKIVELSGITVRQRVKDIEKILSQFLLPKLLNMSTLENNLEVFFKYASIFQIGDIEGQPESMKRNQAISKARLDAANQIDTMLNAQCEENRSFLENLYYSDPPLKNMLFLASLGVPTKMLLEMTDLALSELVEISQLHGEYDMQ